MGSPKAPLIQTCFCWTPLTTPLVPSKPQGSPDVFIWGPQKLINNSSKAGHLTQCDLFRDMLFYGINKFFEKYIFSFLTKCLRRPDETGRSLETPDLSYYSELKERKKEAVWAVALLQPGFSKLELWAIEILSEQIIYLKTTVLVE